MDYKMLGADCQKQDLHKALSESGISKQKYFMSLNRDIAGVPDYYSFLHADGAGTKAIVAYLMYREYGDPSYFAGLAQDALAMNLDDAFCVGHVENLMLSNTIARNAKLLGADSIRAIIQEYSRLVEQLRELGIPIELAGGETADMGDVVRTLVVDATLAGRIKKSLVLDPANVEAGNLIIGISSVGQANYEDKPNSGISSNGLSLARHSILSREYLEKYPEICDPLVERRLAYSGTRKLDVGLDDLFSIGTALLSPTRIHAPVLAKAYEEFGQRIKAVINNTGGGQTKILNFVRGLRIMKDELFEVPAIFKAIQTEGKIDWREMYQVFNMGHRIELYVEAQSADELCSLIQSFGLSAKVLGRVLDGSHGRTAPAEVCLKTEYGEFLYRQDI